MEELAKKNGLVSYKQWKILNRTGHSSLYVAQVDGNPTIPVHVKVFQAGSSTAYEYERDILAAAQGHHVARLLKTFDFEKNGIYNCFVLEKWDGNIYSCIRKAKKLETHNWSSKLDVQRQVISIVRKLHDLGIIISGDLRPQNLCWFPGDRQFKITSFAWAFQGGAKDHELCDYAQPEVGPYSPPEVASAFFSQTLSSLRSSSIACDYWALGMILLEIARDGASFFGRLSRNELLLRLSSPTLQRELDFAIEKIPDHGLRFVLSSLLSVYPEERIGSGVTPASLLSEGGYFAMLDDNHLVIARNKTKSMCVIDQVLEYDSPY